MAKGDDDILLGAPVAAIKEARDTDGDGVSDVQEELEGTNPADASDHVRPEPTLARDEGDRRGDPDRATLQPETGDPRAAMPEGMSVDTGLGGLTDLDGNPLQTGPDRHGVGEDAILEGRVGGNSPRDLQRDPLGSTGDAGSASGGTPPTGADLSFRAPNMGLVSDEDEMGHETNGPDQGGGDDDRPVDTPPAPDPEPWQDPFDPARHTPPPPKPDPSEPDAGQDWDPKDPEEAGSTNPDADGGSAPTEEEIERAIAVRGGDTTPVEGQGGGPQVEGDAPPVRYRDLVTDGGDDSGDIGTADAPRGAPDAPVVHTINPDAGVVRPPTPGGPPPSGGDGDTGLAGASSAATAADAPGAPGFSAVGPGAGDGIQSTVVRGDDGDGDGDGDDDPPGDDPEFVSGVRDTSISAAGDADILGRAPASAPPPTEARPQPAEPAEAVEAFATSYLHETSLPAPDLVASGLASDLGADLRPDIDEPAFVTQLDPGGADLLEGSLPDDDGLDV